MFPQSTNPVDTTLDICADGVSTFLALQKSVDTIAYAA